MSLTINEDNLKSKLYYKNESKPLFVFKKDMYLINLIKKKVDKKTSALINAKLKFPSITIPYSATNKDYSISHSFIGGKNLNQKPNSFEILCSSREINAVSYNQKNSLASENSINHFQFRKSKSQFFDSFCFSPLREHSILKNKEIVSLIKKYRSVLIEDCNNIMMPKGLSAQ